MLVFTFIQCITLYNGEFFKPTFWYFTKSYSIIRAFLFIPVTTPSSLPSISFLSHYTFNGLFAANFFIVLDVSRIIFLFIIRPLMVSWIIILFIFESEKTFDCRLLAVLYFLLSIEFDVLCIVWIIYRLLLISLILVLILILCQYVLSIGIGQIEAFIRCQNTSLFDSLRWLHLTLKSLWIHWWSCQAEQVVSFGHVHTVIPTNWTVAVIHHWHFWISDGYVITLGIIFNLVFKLFITEPLLITGFTIHHLSQSRFRALAANVNDFKTIRNYIWELIVVFILFILVIDSSFNRIRWCLSSLLLSSWALDLLLLYLGLLAFSTVLSTVYITNDVHLVLESFCIDWRRVVAWSKFDGLFNGVHCLVSCLRLDGLIEQLVSLTLVILLCVFSYICLLANWLARLLLITINAIQ